LSVTTAFVGEFPSQFMVKLNTILQDSNVSAKIVSNQTLILFSLKSRKGFQEIVL
jgi:hypothetical protein